MADVKIVFKTEAELNGAKAIQQSLERQIGAAKALGKDFSELETRLKGVNKTLEDHGEQSNKASISVASLNAAVRKASDSIPGLSEALSGLTSPIGAVGSAVGLVIGLFAAWQSRISDTAKTLEGFTPEVLGFNAWQQVLATAQQHASEFAQSLEEQSVSFGRVTQATTRQITEVNALAQAEKSLIDARKDVALREVDVEFAAGRISRTQARADRRRIIQGAGQQGIQAELGAMDETSRLNRSQLAEMDLRARNARGALPGATAERDAISARIARESKSFQDNVQPSLGLESEQLKARRTALEKMIQTGQVGGLLREVGSDKELRGIGSIEEAARRLDVTKGRQEQISRQIEENLPSRRTERSTELAEVNARIRRLEADLARVAPGGEAERLRGEIGTEGRRRDIIARTVPQVQGLQQQSQALGERAADNAETVAIIRELTQDRDSALKTIGKATTDAQKALGVALVEQVQQWNRELASLKATLEATYNHQR